MTECRSNMDKIDILEILVNSIQTEFDHAKVTFESTKKLVQSGDLKAESKWDTRAIEAGYLASAQEARLKQLELELNLLKNIKNHIKNKSDIIKAGSIAFVDVDGDERCYFVTQKTGGHKLKIKNYEFEIHVISLDSPMGNELSGLSNDDSFEFKLNGKIQDCEIIEVI